MNAPRLPSDVVRRERIVRWIDAFEAAPMRLLVGPAGTGKTVTLAHALLMSPGDSVYVCCSSETPLLRAIAQALSTREDLDAILDTMRTRPIRLLAIDEAEHCDANDERVLETMLSDERCNGLLVASRRRNIVSERLIANGVVAMCAHAMLRFDAGDCVAMASGIEVEIDRPLAEHLADVCDGWPIAIAGTIRTARAMQLDLLQAFEQWKSDQRSVVLNYVSADAQKLPDAAKRTWNALVTGASCADADLRELERHGGFVVDADRTLRPFRVVLEMLRNDAAPAMHASTGDPIMVRIFGRFESTIDNQPVLWVRRMDRRIFRYLVLTRDGTAAKEELLKEFWASADERQAAQSLRTACSNIRKAIGMLVGVDHVDDYFNAGDTISVNLDNVTVDVRRFISHVRTANTAYENDDFHTALVHYKQADTLYIGRLGWGDEEERALIPLAQECERLYTIALKRIVEILRKTGATLQAMRYEALLSDNDLRKNVAEA